MQTNPYEAGELNSEDAGVSAEKLRLRLIPMQIIAGVLASGVVFFLGVALVMIEGELNTGMGMLVQLGAAMAGSAVVMHTITSARQPTEKQLREYVEAGEPMQSLLGFFQQRLIVSLAILEGAAMFNGIAIIIEQSWISVVAVSCLTVMIAVRFPTSGSLRHWLDGQRQKLELTQLMPGS